ncbi:MAG: hypothetical protein R6V85_10455 [Polyangia bacterium]
MDDERQPRECPRCGTVNPWTNETCRSCGVSLENAAPFEPGEQEAAQEQEDASDSRRAPRVNIRWILVGAVLTFVVFWLAQRALIESFLADDSAELAPIQNRIRADMGRSVEPGAPMIEAGTEFSEEEKERIHSALADNTAFVFSLLLLLLAPPLSTGLLVSYFTASVREGLIACLVGALAAGLISEGGRLDVGLLIAAVYLVPAALAALGGRRLRRRREG